MSTPLITRPEADAPGAAASDRSARRAERQRRVVLIGFGASVAFHAALFVLLYLSIFEIELKPDTGRVSPRGVEDPGMQVVQVLPVDGPIEEEDRPEVDARRPDASAPSPFRMPSLPSEPAAVAAPSEEPSRPGRPGSPVDRLRPRASDGRLVIDPSTILPEEQTPQQRVAARLKAYNDSIAAEADAARRAMDWTVKGKDGERWGISPDGIHLGRVTLPAPTLDGNAEGREREREWAELQRQADGARIRDRFDDRVKAIREQKDRERAERNAGRDRSDPNGL